MCEIEKERERERERELTVSKETKKTFGSGQLEQKTGRRVQIRIPSQRIKSNISTVVTFVDERANLPIQLISQSNNSAV